MNDYKKINSILVWISALSIILYFIFLPINNPRPNPAKSSPNEEELKLEANPLMLIEREDVNIEKIINPSTNSTQTIEFPKALTPMP